MLLSDTLRTKQLSNDTPKATTWGRRLALFSLITLLAAGLSFAGGNNHKLSSDLEPLKGGHDGGTVDVIVQYNVSPTDAHHQKVQNKGGVLKTKLDFIKSAHYSFPTEALDVLADDPDVAFISPDRPVRGLLDTTLAAVNGGYAQTLGLNGAGIGVALIDSGVSDIPDLHNASGYEVKYAQSLLPTDSSSVDKFGHGTHVAGIISGTGANSTGSKYYRHFVGMAPGVNLINLRVPRLHGIAGRGST